MISRSRWAGTRAVLAVLALLIGLRAAGADVTYVIPLRPGTPEEAAAVRDSTSRVEGGLRIADQDGGWTYEVIVPPGVLCGLYFRAPEDRKPDVVTVSGPPGKPLPSAMRTWNGMQGMAARVPANHPVGAAIRFRFAAKNGPIAVSEVVLRVEMPDLDGDRIGDPVERLMGLAKGQRASIALRPPEPHTSFQTASPYSSGIGVPADAVLVYSDDAARIGSWAEQGYTIQTMGGFRDGPDYVKQHPDEVQTDKAGHPMVIGGSSYYMVPTQARIDIAKRYYENALAAGSTAVCPEEPEFFASAGYSEAFKKEWQARYGTPWQAPDSSVDARYRSEQLKGFLERRQIEQILDDAQRVKPGAARMVAVHSPVTYYQWGIPCPHVDLLRIPSLQEIIGQVWTGTARSPARAAGVREERTFEVGLLEYSSLYNLARGSGKKMWFLMDPVEDNPDRAMEDYHHNYERTLVASLMFPDVDRFEVMPWPDRIYGRVPADFAAEVNTVVASLADMWRYRGQVEAGTRGIGTFVADSMGWQRADPSPSDYDGLYGLSLPLVNHGVPVDVLSLDRVTEPGYLNGAKALLLSYDYLKPMDPAINRTLADWVKRGGSLVVCGGTDAYNAVADSWWRKAGYTSPVEDLFAQLGLPIRNPRVLSVQPSADSWTTLLQGPADERSMRNRKLYTVDLTSLAAQNGSVEVQFTDALPQDGWGPLVASAELRIGGKLATSFRAGSELETRFLAEDNDTHLNTLGRFADGSASWIYRFDNLPRGQQVTLTVDMGDEFVVKGRPGGPPSPLLEAAGTDFERRLNKLRVPRQYPITLYAPPTGVHPLYRIAGQSEPAVWEAPAGRGTVTFVGVAPGYMSATAQASRWVRALAGRACSKAGAPYKESTSYVVHRGPYTAVRALGKPATVEGRYVDLLNASLPLVEDPVVPAQGLAFLLDAGDEKGAPRILTASGRVRARLESERSTAFLVNAPSGTNGATRIWCGRRKAAGAKAFTVLGQPLSATFAQDSGTILVRYPNDPHGVVVRIGWK